MGFARDLQAEARPIWEAIFTHPMLREIRAGTLPLEKFRYFLAQDWHYLDAFARCVGLAIGKARTSGMLERLAGRVLKPIEKPLHRKLFGLVGLSEAEVTSAPIAPTSLGYQNHMLTAAALGTLGETAAALLPCPWTYHEIGKLLGDVRHPVYSEWAAFYVAGGLSGSVAAWTALVDLSAAEAGPAERAAMRAAFLTSSRYEYLFWDMAYRQESWPI